MTEDGEAAGSDEEGVSEEPERRGLRAFLVDAYLGFDRRTLGFTRILLGWLLLMDLARRTPHWLDLYSNAGLVPTHSALHRSGGSHNFSIAFSFGTPLEAWALWAVIFASHAALFLGYRTRLAHVCSLLLQASLNGRTMLVENGGYVVQNLLLLWTVFLPMGDRFSLDALLGSLRRKPERTARELNDRWDPGEARLASPAVSLAGLAIIVQLWAIYFFNVVHKTGEEWRNGTAAHYVLYIDRMVTPVVAAVRDHVPWTMILVGTKLTLAGEALCSILVWLPIARPWARRLLVVTMCGLHIVFGTTFVLGPFAWSMCVFSTLFFSREDWDFAAYAMTRTERERVVLFHPGSGAAFAFCRLLARLDALEHLRFARAKGLSTPLAVRAPGGERVSGALALAEIAQALPFGPAFAWPFRAPGLRALVDAALRVGERLGPSRFFGLPDAAAREASPPAEPPPERPLLDRLLRPVAWAREAAVGVMLLACVNQGVVEMWSVRDLAERGLRALGREPKVPQPELFQALVHKLRFMQGWFMFSPSPVRDDSDVVVDATTVDGRRIDPMTGKPPSWDLTHARSLRYDQIDSDLRARIVLPHNASHREALRDWLTRYHERTGRPEDALVRFEVHALHDENPPFGSHEPLNFTDSVLLSWEATARPTGRDPR